MNIPKAILFGCVCCVWLGALLYGKAQEQRVTIFIYITVAPNT